MALVTGKTEWRDIPHEQGQRFQFRLLSGMELDEADVRATEKALQLIKGLEGSAIQAFQGDRQGRERQATPNYDRSYLVEHGVVGWTYPEPCNEDNIRLLDLMTRDWAAEVVLEINTRPAGELKGSGVPSSMVEESRRSLEEPTD